VAGFDDLTVAELRRRGGLKWSLFPEAIGSFVAEMDFGTAPAVTEALHAAVDTPVFGYLPPALLQGMSEAYAAWSADRYGWTVPPERVRPVADVLAGLAAAIEHFSRPGSPVVLPTPAYMPFLTVPGMIDRELVQVPMDRSGGAFVLDVDAVDRAFAAGAGLLVLTNPHNPTGRVFDDAELAAVTEVVERHGARVFADEIHAPLTFGGARHRPYAATSDAAAGHTVTATSASKAWNTPGLKCGQVILSNDADAAHWEATGYLAEHGTATPGVLATTAAYRDARGWLDDVLAYLDGNRALLASADLPELEVTVPEGTYLAWLDGRGLGLDEPPSAFFTREAGVVMTDGAACGEAGRGGMRLNLAMSRPVLTEALERISAALS
jgi:cysteine-S-conjugate beta-lyase